MGQQENLMGIEIWGTYSTRDHRAPRAFVADVMLYDRLVIPVPAPDDLESWRDRDVERQARLLQILGDRARSIVWDSYLREAWQSKWQGGKTAAGMTNRDAFGMTANVLLGNLPKGVTGVAAAVLFKSRQDILSAIDWKPAPMGTPLPVGEIAAVVGRELLVPDDRGSGLQSRYLRESRKRENFFSLNHPRLCQTRGTFPVRTLRPAIAT